MMFEENFCSHERYINQLLNKQVLRFFLRAGENKESHEVQD